MLLKVNSRLVSAACLTALTLFASGCNQPAPPLTGGAVDLSVQGTQAASGTEAPKQAGEKAKETAKPAPPQEPIASDQPQISSDKTASPADRSGSVAANGTEAPKEPAPAAAKSAESPKPAPPVNQAPPDPAQPPVSGQPAKAEPPAKQAEAAGSAAKAEENIVKQAGKPGTLTFQELYSEVTVRGIKFSEKVNGLNGKKVEMSGYMAPPLAAKVDFFVLTKVALTICPFCSSDADWPQDIVVVFMPKDKAIAPTDHPVKVTGTLSVGSQTDDKTGFVSLVRIMADKVEVLK
ncbi:hypothetical protein O9H85_09785 [Paenibacillus filicis]|uniref:DUF3299 domain-containing protein n=1 Tax=Paenibacillus gyeongsangnamensis TaxID=3388067 RepID=A0ABT4Q790_9BACL|nr:hypothetical protein [Paenibacillus filicis]MCZ8512699.1 hypothetical protein [Paenibacillus filicis]